MDIVPVLRQMIAKYNVNDEEWQAIEWAIKIVSNNKTNLKVADALETIVNLCNKYGETCFGCPLIVEGDYDDYCILDCNDEAIRRGIAKLRGE